MDSGGRPRRWCLLALLLCAALAVTGQLQTAQGLEAAPGGRRRALGAAAAAGQNSTLIYRADAVARISGENFVPFTLDAQEVFLEGFREVLTKLQGPVQMVSYREGYVDLRAPDYPRDPLPYVDLAVAMYHIINASAVDPSADPWGEALAAEAGNFQNWALYCFIIGGWAPPEQSIRLYFYNGAPGTMDKPVDTRAVLVLEAFLGLQLAATGGGGTSAAQASSVAAAIQEAVVGGGSGTLVEVRSRDAAEIEGIAGEDATASAAGAGWQLPLLLLEVTVFTCPAGNGSAPSPACEVQELRRTLEGLAQSEMARQHWATTRVEGLDVLLVRQRPPPAAPDNSSEPWVPWWLSRISQRSLPLMADQPLANATGSGIHVYIASSGIDASHQEFRYMDGRPGTRVEGGWGFEGSSPLQDCTDYDVLYGLGTAAASVVGGLTVGVARNVTLHSLRFRQNCLYDGPASFSPGGLPSALDDFLSTYEKPAVLLINIVWSPLIYTNDDDNYIRTAILKRLDALQKANVTVIAPAGSSMPQEEPCLNIFAAHPGVVSVSGTNAYDGHSIFDAYKSSCIDLYAPAGGLGQGLTVAYPESPSSYITIYDGSYTASWVVAGVAARYLEAHPEAGPDKVRRALVDWATPGTVTMAGEGALLLYSNLTDAGANDTSPGSGTSAAGGGGGGLSAGAIVGIAVGATAAVACIAALLVFLVLDRRRRLHVASAQNISHDGASEWELPEEQVALCLRPDGSKHVLGQGSYGVVYKGVLRGVQTVAVKSVGMGRPANQFVQEVALMKYLSRDPNIVQFIGCCILPSSLLLVTEYMEAGDLRERLSNDPAGELRWYCKGKGIALDIVRGLHFLHASSCIHRDVKSANILLTRDLRAKLSDVGLAQLLAGQPYTRDDCRGTWAWAAPELLLGDEVNAAADLYSLGVVLWELATQDIPTRGRLRQPVVPDECPQGLVDVINACLQAEPSKRPSSREVYELLLACPPHDSASEPSLSTAISSSSGSAGGGSLAARPLGAARASPGPGPSASSRPRIWSWLEQRAGGTGGAQRGLDVPAPGARAGAAGGHQLATSPFAVPPDASCSPGASPPLSNVAPPATDPASGTDDGASHSAHLQSSWSSRFSTLSGKVSPAIRQMVMEVKQRVRQVSARKSDSGASS